jgi:hypothetical protein
MRKWEESHLPATVVSKEKATKKYPGFSSSLSSRSVAFFRLTSFWMVMAF